MQTIATHRYSFSTEAKPSSQMAVASAFVVALLALPAYPLPTCTMQQINNNDDNNTSDNDNNNDKKCHTFQLMMS
jgi:hypothetical protein